MRRFVLSALLCIGFLSAGHAEGADAAKDKPAAIPQTTRNDIVADSQVREAALKELYARLKRTSKDDAPRVQATINVLLAKTGNAAADVFLEWADESVAAGNNAQALDYLDGAILLTPNAPEPYHKRATVLYAQTLHAAALADLERTLVLEPRHTGALMGLGALLSDLGEDKKALLALRKALELNPNLEDAQKLEATLSKKIEGEGI